MAQPSAAYLERLLGGASFIALAAVKDGEVEGGLAAYELQKYGQERNQAEKARGRPPLRHPDPARVTPAGGSRQLRSASKTPPCSSVAWT